MMLHTIINYVHLFPDISEETLQNYALTSFKSELESLIKDGVIVKQGNTYKLSPVAKSTYEAAIDDESDNEIRNIIFEGMKHNYNLD